MTEQNNPTYPSISVHNVEASMVSVSVTRYEMGFGTIDIKIGDIGITLFANTHEEAHAVANAFSKYTSEAS